MTKNQWVVQTSRGQALGRKVAKLAKNGTFHLIEGLGHLSLVGHKPEVVKAKIQSIIEAETKGSEQLTPTS